MKTHFAPNIVERTRRRAAMTQKDLAIKANLSVMSIVRAEQCLLPGLSDDLAHALSDINFALYARSYQQIYKQEREDRIIVFSDNLTSSDDYTKNLKDALAYALDHFTPTYAVVPASGSSTDRVQSELRMRHPLYLARTHLFSKYGLPTSQVKFCTLTGAHTATVSAIERGKIALSDAPTFVTTLREVLKFTSADIDLLETMCLRCI